MNRFLGPKVPIVYPMDDLETDAPMENIPSFIIIYPKEHPNAGQQR